MADRRPLVNRGRGCLTPTFVTTMRPNGTHRLYTRVGVEPSLPLRAGRGALRCSVPAAIGIGWNGFHRAGSGDRVFGNAGLGHSTPFMVGPIRWTERAPFLALFGDDRLRRLSGLDGETSSVVPLVPNLVR